MLNDTKISNFFSELKGKQCCRKRVGAGRSLSIGFGKKIPNLNSKTADSFYGEWEIGTYSSSWRIVANGEIICGSMNVVDSIDELDQQIQALLLGSIVNIENMSPFDIRVSLDQGIFIDFMCADDEGDEMFHVFGPEFFYIEYKYADGWKIGKSNVPWT